MQKQLTLAAAALILLTGSALAQNNGNNSANGANANQSAMPAGGSANANGAANGAAGANGASGVNASGAASDNSGSVSAATRRRPRQARN